MRNHFQSILFCSLVFLFSIALQAEENLLKNPGFEKGFSDKGIGEDWSDNSSWAPVKVIYAAEKDNPHSGKFAQKITCTEFKGGAVQFVQFGFPLKKGIRYAVSLWLRSDEPLGVEIILRKTGAPYTTYISKPFKVKKEWQEFRFEDKVAEGDQSAFFVIKLGMTGTLYVDDVVCKVAASQEDPNAKLFPPQIPVPLNFFGMHMHEAAGRTAWPKVPFKTWRLWDAGVSWYTLEPKKGEWHLEKLDAYLKLAKEHNVELILPFALTPTWASARPDEKSAYGVNGLAAEPADIEDWRNYVRTVAEHCKGQVHIYEGWNEPNNGAQPFAFFTGSKDKLIELQQEMYKIVKSVDPSAVVISPAVTGDTLYLDGLFERCLDSCMDILGFHFYVWPAGPEKMLPMIRAVRSVMTEYKIDKPLWNTEAGWTIESNLVKIAKGQEGISAIPIKTAGDFVARTYLLSWAAGIGSYCFYSWDNRTMGLVESDGSYKIAANAYGEITRWLTGTVMKSCAMDGNGTWTAMIERDKKTALIIWNPDAETLFTIPPGDFKQAKDIFGKELTITDSKIIVGPTPILIE